MSAKQYIDLMKQKYVTPKMWSAQQKCNHFHAVEDGRLNNYDELYLEYLKKCNTWENAEAIARIFIIR